MFQLAAWAMSQQVALFFDVVVPLYKFMFGSSKREGCMDDFLRLV